MPFFDRNNRALPGNWECPEGYTQQVPIYEDFDGVWSYEDRKIKPCKWVSTDIKLEKCSICGTSFRYS